MSNLVERIGSQQISSNLARATERGQGLPRPPFAAGLRELNPGMLKTRDDAAMWRALAAVGIALAVIAVLAAADESGSLDLPGDFLQFGQKSSSLTEPVAMIPTPRAFLPSLRLPSTGGDPLQ